MNKRIRRTLPLTLAALVLGPAFARDEYTRNFDSTQSVASGRRLRMIHRLGDVHIRAHASPELNVHALVRVSSSSSGEARRFAESIRIEVQPSGSDMLIETIYPKTEAFGWFKNSSYSVSYEIGMPESCPLEVTNAFGEVTVTGLRAGAQIHTSHGKLEVRDGRGSLRLENAFAGVTVARNQGDVTVTNTNGAVDVSDVSGSVHVKDRFAKVTVARSGGGVILNGNGEVEVNRIEGDMRLTTSFASVTAAEVKGNLTVVNQNGGVEALRVTGSADIATSFATVHFKDIGGALRVKSNNGAVEGRSAVGPASIQNSFAQVTLEDIRKQVRVVGQNSGVTLTELGDDAFVTTNFAAVHISRVKGAVEVHSQNGEVELELNRQEPCRPVEIHNSFASIRVRMPENSSFALTAKTSFGEIHSDFPMMVSGALKADSISGKIGAGGCPMTLVGQNGAIQILNSGRR